VIYLTRSFFIFHNKRVIFLIIKFIREVIKALFAGVVTGICTSIDVMLGCVPIIVILKYDAAIYIHCVIIYLFHHSDSVHF
jgi:hypothetical protein